MLTKKIFKEVAEILDRHGADHEIANDFIKMFARENPQFNTERFLKACGLM